MKVSLRRNKVDPHFYRSFNEDLRHMTNEQLQEHYASKGRKEVDTRIGNPSFERGLSYKDSTSNSIATSTMICDIFRPPI